MDIVTIFNIVVYVIVFLFGITIGSFLNVCILRLPRGESLITNNSHCMTCNTEIKRYDLIPVFSWLILRGRCRACGAKISPRYMLVELLTGILFIVNYAVYPYDTNGLYFVMLSLFMSGLIVLTFQDIDTQTMCVSVLVYTLIISVITHVLTFIDDGDGNGFSIVRMPADLKSCIIGGLAVGGGLLLIGFAITPAVYVLLLSQDHKDLRRLNRALNNTNDNHERSKLMRKIDHTKENIKKTGPVFGFGMGDIIMMVAGGFMFGLKATCFATIIAIITGAVYGIVKKATESEDSGESAFAFGPFLALGLLCGAYFGIPAADAYINYMFG